MRDLMLLGAMFFIVPMALRNPFAAYIIWGWTAFMAVEEYVYGFMAGVRFNLIFALITLGLLLINLKSNKRKWLGGRTSILLLIWLAHGTLSAIFAYPDVPSNWLIYEKIVKVLVFVLVMPFLIYGRLRIHMFIVALCLGVSFHGLIEGLKYLNSSGAHHVQGLAKFGDNNLFAVMILMGLPLLVYLYYQSSNRWAKFAAISGAALTVAAVMGTHSRGGLVAIVLVVGWLIFTGRRRVRGMVIAGSLALLVLTFAPSSWLDRMDTIQTADQDASFLGRVEAWQISSAIALANPVLGGGFHALETPVVWGMFRGNTGLLGFLPSYDYSPVNFRAAHSAYFEVLGDRGIFGFILFILILVNILLTASESKRLAIEIGPKMHWAVDLSNALSASAIAFMVGGGGVSVAYSEMFYVIAMLTEVLKHHVVEVGKSNTATIG